MFQVEIVVIGLGNLTAVGRITVDPKVIVGALAIIKLFLLRQ